MDTEGFVLKAKVHSAKVMDWDGIKTLLQRADEHFPRLKHLSVGGRRLPWRREGQGVGGEDVRLECGSRRASAKARTEEGVLVAWAEQWSHEGVVVDWKKIMPPEGFVVLPRRWEVERSFAWICHNRRMSKDYERLCASGEAFVYAAMSRLMLRRLAGA